MLSSLSKTCTGNFHSSSVHQFKTEKFSLLTWLFADKFFVFQINDSTNDCPSAHTNVKIFNDFVIFKISIKRLGLRNDKLLWGFSVVFNFRNVLFFYSGWLFSSFRLLFLNCLIERWRQFEINHGFLKFESFIIFRVDRIRRELLRVTDFNFIIEDFFKF